LFDAGVSYGNFLWLVVEPDETQFKQAIRILELSTGLRYGNNTAGAALAGKGGPNSVNPMNQRFSVSYVTGSHAFKAGQLWVEGRQKGFHTVDNDLWYTFLNGRPSTLTQWASPVAYGQSSRNLGLFAQDQWTIQRLTLNLGARFDYSTAGCRRGRARGPVRSRVQLRSRGQRAQFQGRESPSGRCL